MSDKIREHIEKQLPAAKELILNFWYIGRKFVWGCVVFAVACVFLGLSWVSEGTWKELTIFVTGFLFAANAAEKFTEAKGLSASPSPDAAKAAEVPPPTPVQTGGSLGLPPVP